MQLNDATQLGLLVRDARERAGLSQTALAQKAGVQRPWLSRLEAGKGNPTFDVLLRVMEAVGLIVDVHPPRAVEALAGSAKTPQFPKVDLAEVLKSIDSARVAFAVPESWAKTFDLMEKVGYRFDPARFAVSEGGHPEALETERR